MNVLRHIALSFLLVTGIFSAVLYTSCTKDACKGVTCMNGAQCARGTCLCKPGMGGVNCETVYRELYANTYSGSGRATGKLDSVRTVDSSLNNYNLIFKAGTDTADYTTMTLEWSDSTGRDVLTMPIILHNFSNGGSTFMVSNFTQDTFIYSGSGSVSNVSATLNLTRRHPRGSSTVTFSLVSFSRQ